MPHLAISSFTKAASSRKSSAMAESTTESLLSATLLKAMVTVMMVTTTLNARSPSGGTHVAQPLAVSPETPRASTTTSRSRIPGANGGVTKVSFALTLMKTAKVSVACISMLKPSMECTKTDELCQKQHK